MSNAFSWQGPSQILKQPKRKSKAKPRTSAERTERVLSERFNGSFSKAVASVRGGD